MKKKAFYIVGDSWLAHRAAYRVTGDSSFLPLQDFFVINHSVSGASNSDIIQRVKTAVIDLRAWDVEPVFCVGLSEVGRGLLDEFRLAHPVPDVGDYMKSVLMKQHEIIVDCLAGYPCYVCTAWVSNPFGNKSIVDFIDPYLAQSNDCYAVANGIYSWLSDRLDIFKFDKSSFVNAIDRKQKYEARLLCDPYIDTTMHPDPLTSDQIYRDFFSHVIDCVN